MRDEELSVLLEEAALIGSEPALRKLRDRSGRKATKAEVLAARERTDRIGLDGEVLAHLHLSQMKHSGLLTNVRWMSEENAVSAWDFEVTESSGELVRYDAKSTTGKFERSSFFLSPAEAVAASDSKTPYRIIRISDLSKDGGVCHISENINRLAASIIESVRHFPEGVLPSGFSIDVDRIAWSEPTSIRRPDEPE